MHVDSAEPLQIALVQQCKPLPASNHCLHIIAEGTHFSLHRQQPDVFIQLRQVFNHVPGHARADVKCYDLAVNRCRSLTEMLATVVATPCVDGILREALYGPSSMWEHCAALPHICADHRGPGNSASRLVAGFPVPPC